MLCALSIADRHGEVTATAALLCSRQGPVVRADIESSCASYRNSFPCQNSVSSGCAHLWPRVGNLGREHSGSTAPMQLGRKSTRPKAKRSHWTLPQPSSPEEDGVFMVWAPGCATWQFVRGAPGAGAALPVVLALTDVASAALAELVSAQETQD